MQHNLINLAIDLAADPTTIAEAARIARASTSGMMRHLAGGPAVVLESAGDSALDRLQAFVGPLAPSDPQKWSGLLLMAHALLGHADLAPGVFEVELQAFRNATSLVRTVIQKSGGKCPPVAAPIAIAMVDAVLRHPMCEADKQLQCDLLRARASFTEWGPGGRNSARMTQLFDSILTCFKQQNWRHNAADPVKRMVMLGFHSRIGDTCIVCSVPSPTHIALLALETKAGVKGLAVIARPLIEARHPGVQVHEDDDATRVALELELAVGDAPLVAVDLVHAVTRINAAAETLLSLRSA